jgi:hypothetical protein
MKVIKAEGWNNKYCGPAALSAITRKPLPEVTRVLREISGRRAIRGTHHAWMIMALRQLGFTTGDMSGYCYKAKNEKEPTLATWLRENYRNPNEIILVVLTGHYVVVKGRKLVDNKHPNGVSVKRFPNRRKRVKRFWIVEKANG